LLTPTDLKPKSGCFGPPQHRIQESYTEWKKHNLKQEHGIARKRIHAPIFLEKIMAKRFQRSLD
jgi:hypothetical protein